MFLLLLFLLLIISLFIIKYEEKTLIEHLLTSIDLLKDEQPTHTQQENNADGAGTDGINTNAADVSQSTEATDKDEPYFCTRGSEEEMNSDSLFTMHDNRAIFSCHNYDLSNESGSLDYSGYNFKEDKYHLVPDPLAIHENENAVHRHKSVCECKNLCAENKNCGGFLYYRRNVHQSGMPGDCWLKNTNTELSPDLVTNIEEDCPFNVDNRLSECPCYRYIDFDDAFIFYDKKGFTSDKFIPRLPAWQPSMGISESVLDDILVVNPDTELKEEVWPLFEEFYDTFQHLNVESLTTQEIMSFGTKYGTIKMFAKGIRDEGWFINEDTDTQKQFKQWLINHGFLDYHEVYWAEVSL